MVEFNNKKYNVIINYRDGFDEDAFLERATDMFLEYDYIFGDWAYGKLRLKGFYKSDNRKVTKTNDIKNLDIHIKEDCAFECKHFLLEKIG